MKIQCVIIRIVFLVYFVTIYIAYAQEAIENVTFNRLSPGDVVRVRMVDFQPLEGKFLQMKHDTLVIQLARNEKGLTISSIDWL